MMIYMTNDKKLPWCSFTNKFKNTQNMFQQLLRERLQKKYTYKLFEMVPSDLKDCLKKVLTLSFNEKPPYDYIIECLKRSFMNSLKEKTPVAPPSCLSAKSMPAVDLTEKALQDHKFEWN